MEYVNDATQGLGMDDEWLQVHEWNREIPPKRESCVHEAIQWRARLQDAETPAVVAWDGTLTYSELMRQIDVFSHGLIVHGVKRGDRILACCEKSKNAVISMIGMMQAGAVWIPCDPDTPFEQLQTILQDTKPALMVVIKATAAQLHNPRLHFPRVVTVDEVLSLGQQADSETANSMSIHMSVDSSMPALIMFTSGSTGKRNGVVISHSAMVTAALSYASTLELGMNSRMMQFTAFVWLPCTVEILATLMQGGQVFIPSEYDRLNNASLFMKEHAINVAVMTPTFAATLHLESLPALRVLGLGGEKVSQDLVDRWSRTVKLILCYGSTETNLCILEWIQPGDYTTSAGLPCGCRVWITEPDDIDTLVPVGMEGELIIESHTLATEYLNNPEKTASKFVSKTAWSTVPALSVTARLCRTGDKARYHPDGRISLLGRLDDAVKIRGQKVTLAEVEHHLRGLLPSSQLAVEAVRFRGQEDNMDPVLAAFIAIDSAESDDSTANGIFTDATTSLDSAWEIQQRIQPRLDVLLPRYMQPTVYIPLSCMPLLPSGKIDRRQLRCKASELAWDDVIAAPLAGSSSTEQAPRDEVEKWVHQLWCEQLHISKPEKLGRGNNFFRVGGNSLAAIRMVAAARHLGLDMHVQMIFEHPTVEELASMVRPLAANANGSSSSALDDTDTIREEPLSIPEQHGLETARVIDTYPATPLQEGLLALAMQKPGAYTVTIELPLLDKIDLARFQCSWEALVRRLPILRTRFLQGAHGIRQVVLDEEPEWSDSHSFNSWKDTLSEGLLTGSKLHAYTLKDISNGTRSFQWMVHHSILDAWSIELIFQLLEAQYRGTTPLHPIIGMHGLLNHITDMDSDTTRAYWRSQLHGADYLAWPPLPQPAYTPAADTTCRQKIQFQVPQSTRFTVATILRAAWAVLLSKYAGTEDVVFGATLNGRSAPVAGLEALIAPTIVTVPVRVVLPPSQGVSELLDKVQAQAAAMIPHEHTGLQNIRRLSPEIRRACDFQTLLLVQNHSPEGALHFQGSTASVADWLNFGAYSLVMECEPVRGGVVCHVTYDALVFTSELQIQSIIAQFGQVIMRLCNGQQQQSTISQISIFSERDRELLRERNSHIPRAAETSAPYELQRLVTAGSSDHLAVEAWDGILTLQELDEKSAILAAYLVREFRIGPEDIVPIVLPKSIWAVVSMLAVWKAGAAFASVDSSHPTSWIQHIVSQCQCRVLLSAASVLPSLPKMASASCLIVDGTLLLDLCRQLTEHALPSPAQISPWSAAYVIFTSGSTGIPKGIIHTHSSYMSSVQGRQAMIHKRGERVLQFASFSFDICIDDIWTTLLMGGTVCIPSDGDRDNGLVDFINRARITYAELTPSLARFLPPASLPSLKYMVLSGEPSTKQDKARWLESGVTVLDEYGPAEVAIKSNIKIFQPASGANDKGHPKGCIAWITEPGNPQKLQGIGALGELLLEGPILARSYLNDPVKTDLSFIYNPDWLPVKAHGRRRMYRTGDLASYGPDGSVYIHGRQDAQVKLNGQRVELEQVEGRLNAHLGYEWRILCDVARLPTAQSTDEQRLVAYLAGVDDGLDHWKLRDVMKGRCRGLYKTLSLELPRFMIPTAVIVVDRMPLSKSGKMNRDILKTRASTVNAASAIFLHAIDEAAECTQEDSSPWTDMEKVLESLWRQTLGLGDEHTVHRHDSFFHLGGDSISAMRLASLASQEPFLIGITVADIFRSPVLAKMAMVAVRQARNSIGASPSALSAATPFEQVGPIFALQDLLASIAQSCNVSESSITDIYPSSSIQEGIVAVSLKRSGFYMAQHVFRLPRDVNVNRLIKAWLTVIARTTILRTRLVQYEERLWQAVVDEPAIIEKSSSSLDTYLEQDRLNVMALGQQMSRHSIVAGLGSDNDNSEAYLVWSIHHALYDGWSLRLILQAVNSVYLGQTAWSPPTEYRFFIKYLAAAVDADAAQSYWHAALAGSSATCCPYPLLSSPSYQPSAGASARSQWTLPRSRPPSTTLASILCASWVLVSAVYADSDDIVFGHTVNGRNIPCSNVVEIEGPVFTTVPFRARISRMETIETFLRRIYNETVNMVPHQHLGLQNIAQLGADCQAACRFNTQLVIQTPEDPRSYSQCMGERVQHLIDYRFLNPFALMLQMTSHNEGVVEADVSFDPSLIHPVQMQRILGHLEAVSCRLCLAAPTDVVDQVTAITTSDITEILSWNEGISASPPLDGGSSIASLFGRSCELRPRAEAVCAWNGSLKYAELDCLSSQLSQRLRGLGAGCDMVVPVCFEKSMYVVVATLAVIKAGAAFCLLDISHPAARIRGLIQEAGATIILTSSDLEPRLRGLIPGATLVIVEHEIHGMGFPLSEEAPSRTIHPSDLACVIFTSGSTGKPKGILLQHQAICTSILSHGPAMGLNTTSRVFQFASHAFDMAVYDILTTLIHGGCICIPSEVERMNDLAGAIQRTKANWAFLTPSTLSLLHPDQVQGLQTLVVGGEDLTETIRRTWVERVHLFQCSGPAETTTSIAGRMLATTARNCIGRGVGSLCWIVDPSNHHRLQPIGVVGELLIEGPTLAREYLHDPIQTARAFISLPDWAKWDFSLLAGTGPGSSTRRAFKTGDLVQYAPDGSLLFIGRKDNQVKIRGQRLELAEVEAGLHRLLPGLQVIAETVALDEVDEPRRILCGFVARRGECSKIHVSSQELPTLDWVLRDDLPSMEDIELALTETLPSYMIPQLLIPITHIPLNSSGKVARNELKRLQPELSRSTIALLRNSRAATLTADDAHSAPSLEVPPATLQLRRLWAHVLHVEEQSIKGDDHFLRLGGDSIAAMRLVSRARQAGWVLTVADVFQRPRLAQMAGALRATRTSQELLNYEPFSLLGIQAVATRTLEDVYTALGVSRAEVEDIYPCTPLQEGLMSMSLETPGQYVAQHVFELLPQVDIETFKAACEQVVQRHAILRTRMVMLSSSRMVQVVLRQDPIVWAVEDDVTSYLLGDRSRPIGLNQSLSRWALLGTDRRTFVWTQHHASYDGTSLPLLCMHIRTTYNRIIGITPDPTKEEDDDDAVPPDVPYAHFIHHLVHSDSEAQSRSWQEYLEGGTRTAFPRAIPPGYRPRPNSTVSHVAVMGQKRSPTITLPTLLRAAWAVVLKAHADSADVIFDMAVSGRSVAVAHIEAVTGPTLATVPVRIAVDPMQRSIEAFLSAVQADAVAMTAHEHFGLHNIQKINPATRALCSSLTLLVIQPEEKPDADPTSAIWQPVRVEGLETFHSHALTIICTILRTGTTNEVLLEAFFDSTVLNEADAQCLLGHLAVALDQLNAKAAEKIGDINITSSHDRQRIWEMNSFVPPTVAMRIHDLVHWHMLTRPHAQAVEAWDGSLSYGELDVLSTKLANHLVGLGVLPGSVVPILTEKSFWTPVAALAVLRAGSAFFLIDVSHPESRASQFIHAVVKPAVIIASETQRHLADSMQIPVVELRSKSVSSWSTNPTCDWKSVDSSPDSLAYVILTSGSTGAPKAACIQHKAYCSGAAGHVASTELTSSSRVLQFASYSFDDSIKDILSTLMIGACICIPSETDRTGNLAQAMAALRINWAHLTPTFARSLDPRSMPHTFKTLLLGGEPMSAQDVLQWSPHVRLINAYGPSELCVTCSVNPSPTPDDPTNIGRPVGSVAWVCDPSNPHRLAPYGTVGELLIEGPLQCSGYLHNAASTAAAFVTNPDFLASRRQGDTQLYRTGDLVRYAHDGSLIYLGRRDSQVKIRGQRVELGEIEFQVNCRLVHPWQAAVELITTDQASFLVAFLHRPVPDNSGFGQRKSSVDIPSRVVQEMVADIDAQLALRIPHYMKPSFYLPLSHLPRTRTGKTDRRCLRELAASLSVDERAVYAPAEVPHVSSSRRPLVTDMEKLVGLIWTQVLNRNTLSISNITTATSFFAIGGDSISAIEVLTRLRREGIELSLREVLQRPTVHELCAYIGVLQQEPDPVSSNTSTVESSQEAASNYSNREDSANSSSGMSSLAIVEKQQSFFPLSPIQRFFFSMNPEGNDAEQLSLAVTLPRIECHHLASALESLVKIHDAFRLRFIRDDAGQWRQFVLDMSMPVSQSIHVEEYPFLEGVRDLSVIATEMRDRINITHGPMLAMALIQHGCEQQLFLTAHHLIVDLVSWRIILHDLDELLASDASTANLSRSLSYMDWCTMQADLICCDDKVNDNLKGNVDIDTAYWGGLPCPVPVTPYITRRVELTPMASQALIDGCHAGLGVRPHEVFQAALLYSFQQIFPDRFIPAVFNSSHGRHLIDKADLSHTVGWCTVFYPIQIKTQAQSASLQGMIRAVHDEHQAWEHRAWRWFASRVFHPADLVECGLGEIAFNYTGQYQSFERGPTTQGRFRLTSWNSQQDTTLIDQSSTRRRTALFEVIMGCFEGQVSATVSYSPHLAHQKRIERWIDEFGKSCEQSAMLL